MNCANCGAAVLVDRATHATFCLYCGTESLPPVPVDGVADLRETDYPCPTGDSTLSEGELESFGVLYCIGCRGLLIAMSEFMPLVARLRAYRDRPVTSLPPRPSTSSTPRNCPKCTKPMDTHPYMGPGNIEIDTCERCEVTWLDRGELQRVVVAPDYVYGPPLYSNYEPVGDADEPERGFFERLLGR